MASIAFDVAARVLPEKLRDALDSRSYRKLHDAVNHTLTRFSSARPHSVFTPDGGSRSHLSHFSGANAPKS